MTMWAGFACFCLVAALWLAAAAAAENRLKKSGYRSLTAYAAYIQFYQDKRELNKLGIPQQLRRAFGPFAVFGVSFNAMSLLGGSALFFAYAWSTDHTGLIVWGWPLLGLMSLAIHCVQAELMSAVPSAGGGYHASLLLGGRFRGILTGWLQLGGQIAMLSFLNLAAATWISGFLPESSGRSAGTLLLLTAFALGQLSFCLFSNYGFSILQKGAAILQIAAAAGAIIAMTLYLWPSFGFEDLYSHSSARLSQAMPGPGGAGWLIGVLLLYRMFMGQGTAEHLAEETIEPRIRLPWGHVLSGAYVYAGGFILIGLAAMVMLHSSGGGTSGAAFLEASAPWGGPWRIAAAAAIGICLFAAGCSVLLAASRLVGSLSRDASFPSSDVFAFVLRRGRSFAAGAVLTAAAALVLPLAAYLAHGGREGGVLFLLPLAILLQNGALLIPVILSMTPTGSKLLAELQPLWSIGSMSRYAKPTAAAALAGMMLVAAIFNPASAMSAAIWLLLCGVACRLAMRAADDGWDQGRMRPQEELLRAERQHPQ